jgi:hypothetical protein
MSILSVLGELFEEMQVSGCTYQEAQQRRELRRCDEIVEYTEPTNVVCLDTERARRAAPRT